MKKASAYNLRFTHKVHAYGPPDSFGEKPDVFATGSPLWGYLDTPSSSKADYLESQQNTQIGVVHIRNFVSVKMQDTLTDSRFGDEWDVLSVHRDESELETVCEVRKRG